MPAAATGSAAGARRVLYPGSFDPIHIGHVDIIEQAAALFGTVVVTVMYNREKPSGMFAIDERLDMVRESLAHVGGVEVAASTGLAIDAARDLGADFMVKGLRNTTDFDIEQQMAHTNQSVGGVATVYLPCRPDQVFVSSRFIREIAQYGRDVSHLVPAPVQQRFALRFPPDQPPRDLP